VVFGDPFVDKSALKQAAAELYELSDADVERAFAALSESEDFKNENQTEKLRKLIRKDETQSLI
jgi:hypothetical protein